MSWTYKENPPSPNFAIITSRHYFNKILTIEILCSCLYFQAQIWFISKWSFSKYDNNNYYHHHHHHHHHLCTGYLQLYTGIKTIFFGVESVVVIMYLQFVLHVILFGSWNMFCTLTLALSAVCVQCTIWLFTVVTWFCALPVCCSGFVWVILRLYQLPLFLLVSLLILYSTCAEFALCVRCLHFRIASASFLITFLSPEMQFLLTYVSLFHYHVLWCPVYC